MAVWLWETDYGDYEPFLPAVSNQVEAAYSSGAHSCQFSVRGYGPPSHAIDLRRMRQRNLHTGYERKVNRLDGGSSVAWEYEDNGWRLYDVSSSAQLEAAYNGGQQAIVLHIGRGYLVDVVNMKQRNQLTGYTRDVRRRPLGTAAGAAVPVAAAAPPSAAAPRANAPVAVAAPPSAAGAASASPAAVLTVADVKAMTAWDEVPFAQLGTDEECCICLDDFEDLGYGARLSRCHGHFFHPTCILHSFQRKPECPQCKERYGVVTGNQPQGQMHTRREVQSLPGYGGCGTIEMVFSFPNGVQTAEHLRPGLNYHGTQRHAFLPDNDEGNEAGAMPYFTAATGARICIDTRAPVVGLASAGNCLGKETALCCGGLTYDGAPERCDFRFDSLQNVPNRRTGAPWVSVRVCVVCFARPTSSDSCHARVSDAGTLPTSIECGLNWRETACNKILISSYLVILRIL